MAGGTVIQPQGEDEGKDEGERIGEWWYCNPAPGGGGTREERGWGW